MRRGTQSCPERACARQGGRRTNVDTRLAETRSTQNTHLARSYSVSQCCRGQAKRKRDRGHAAKRFAVHPNAGSKIIMLPVQEHRTRRAATQVPLHADATTGDTNSTKRAP